MREEQVISAFAALSQRTRLSIIRLLMTAGPEGMSAGAIGEAVGASSSRLSFHLSHLERTGLVTSRRNARSIIYTPVYPTFSGLVEFLIVETRQERLEIGNGLAAARRKAKAV